MVHWPEWTREVSRQRALISTTEMVRSAWCVRREGKETSGQGHAESGYRKLHG